MTNEIELAPRSLAVPEPDHFELYTRDRRKAILEALRPKDDDPTGSLPKDAARYAGISPKLLKSWLDHGEHYPNGPLGRFNREVKRIMAQKNDILRKEIFETAKGKKWEGIARIGEQMDPETWSRPSEGTTVNVGISITDRMAEVNASRGKALPGD